MNGSIVPGTDPHQIAIGERRSWRVIVKSVRPLADARHRLNTPEIQTPEPVDVGEHGRELVAEGVDAVLGNSQPREAGDLADLGVGEGLNGSGAGMR
jgi:hypothetical protein